MRKIQERQKEEKKEVVPDFEREFRLKEEILDFWVSAKGYVKKSSALYISVLKRLMDKTSDMLSEELGEEGADYKHRTRTFVTALLLTVVGFLISSCEFTGGSYPLSVAIVASAGSRVKKRGELAPRLIVGLAFFSVIMSTLRMGGNGLMYFTVVFTVFILRSVITKGEFNEGQTFRTMVSFFASVILAAFIAVMDSFSLTSVFTGVSIAVIAPLFTYLFSGLFVSIGDPLFESGMKMRVEVGLAAVFFALVLALSNVGILGFSLAASVAFAVTCIVSKYMGSMHGGVFGMLGGIASGGGLFASVFGVIGVISAVFFSVSDLLALAVSVFISSAVSVYIDGFQGLLTTLPEVLFGCVAVYPILKLLPVGEERISLMSNAVSTSEQHERESVECSLKKLSGTFASLSEVFFAVTDTLKTPTLDDVTRTVDKAYCKVCASCSMSGTCWSRHYTDSNDVKGLIARTVIEKGRVTKDVLPEHFQCIRADELLDAVNKKYASLCCGSNGASNANLIAGEYRTVSKLLENTAKSFRDSEAENMELGKKAYRAMRSLSTPFGRIEAWGRRKSVIDVFGVQPERIERSAAEILAAFETECSMLFEEPEFIKLQTTSALRMKRRAPITLECAKKSMSKKGERVNGDSISFFEKDDGRFYALICDGMGSGRSAALTSRLASVFLERVLTCTDDKKLTLDMLNSMLIAKDDECFTTLDLIEIDLFEMKAGFIKAGASPSFIARDDNIYKINSATLPAGIINGFSAEETGVSVRGGDLIVMLSDGIMGDDSRDDGAWLVQLLDSNRDKSAFELCDLILDGALSRFDASDDMSVAVISVHKA